MHVLHFSTESQNTEVSVTLLKSDSTTDALPAWKFSEQTRETFAVESVFGIVLGRLIGHLEFFKRNGVKDVFW